MEKEKIFGIIIALFTVSFIFLFNFEPSTIWKPESNFSTNKSPKGAIEERNASENNTSYPVHPLLSDCKKVKNPIEKQFCLSDVAEIQNDAEICKRIEGKYIRRFCIARITLNKTKCKRLNDQKLIETCFNSIKMKKEVRTE